MSGAHWAETYIGMPAPDCWAFVRRVWRERFGLIIPVVPYLSDDARAVRRSLAEAEGHGWLQVQVPQEGDGVMMGKGLRACHVGIWVEPDAGVGDAAGALHWVTGNAVVFTVPGQMASFGYHIKGFWRHPDLAVRS